METWNVLLSVFHQASIVFGGLFSFYETWMRFQLWVNYSLLLWISVTHVRTPFYQFDLNVFSLVLNLWRLVKKWSGHILQSSNTDLETSDEMPDEAHSLTFLFSSELSSVRLLAVSFSRLVQAPAPAPVSTSPWSWWNPSWWRCSPGTLFASTRAWPWTASHRPTTSPSSLSNINRRPNIWAWDSYRDREAAVKHSEARCVFHASPYVHAVSVAKFRVRFFFTFLWLYKVNFYMLCVWHLYFFLNCDGLFEMNIWAEVNVIYCANTLSCLLLFLHVFNINTQV